MAGTSGVTQINKDYLNQLKGQLSEILSQVDQELTGIGAYNAPGSTGWLKPVDNTLSVSAGGSSFNAGSELNAALKTMGGSVNDQLTWLKKVLTDMINEITTTVDSMSNTETLNTETVDQLINDFQSTINDMNNPPGSGSGSGSGSGNPNSGSGNPNSGSGG
jgi:hypothetical protein